VRVDNPDPSLRHIDKGEQNRNIALRADQQKFAVCYNRELHK